MKFAEYVNEGDMDFKKALKKFIDGSQKIIDRDFKINYDNLQPAQLSYKIGPKYVKVLYKSGMPKGMPIDSGQESVWAFIDKNTGEIYKPASWRAPAKHPRGNIYDQNNGLGAVSPTGHIVYMR